MKDHIRVQHIFKTIYDVTGVTREYMIDRRDAFEEYNRQYDAQFKSEERQRLQGAADMFRAIGFQQQKGE